MYLSVDEVCQAYPWHTLTIGYIAHPSHVMIALLHSTIGSVHIIHVMPYLRVWCSGVDKGTSLPSVDANIARSSVVYSSSFSPISYYNHIYYM
jgi:hypothetical protein